MTKTKDKKYQTLVLGLLFDGIGLLSSSYVVPFLGDFSDIIWAPLAGWLMTRLYKGNVGKAAGVFAFVEELLPGLDVIPSFTIMWIYTYLLKGTKKGKIIEIDAE